MVMLITVGGVDPKTITNTDLPSPSVLESLLVELISWERLLQLWLLEVLCSGNMVSETCLWQCKILIFLDEGATTHHDHHFADPIFVTVAKYLQPKHVSPPTFYSQTECKIETSFKLMPNFTSSDNRRYEGLLLLFSLIANFCFKNEDAGFANGLLSDAKQLYNLGKKNPGVANPIIPNLHKFYK